MHVSLSSPRVGVGEGGRKAGRPRGFCHFLEARVKFSTPGHLVNVKFVISPLKFLTQQTILGELHNVKFPAS